MQPKLSVMRKNGTTNLKRRVDPGSRIGRAIAAITRKPEWSREEFIQLVNSLCDNYDQARSLRDNLQRCGYVEYTMVVTDLAREKMLLVKEKK